MVEDIDELHHVGHVVWDLEKLVAVYRRLGFAVGPPAYPMASPDPGAAPRPLGLAQAHVDFRRNFIELLACLRDDGSSPVPGDAQRIAIHGPDVSAEQLARLHATVTQVSDGIRTRVQRFEGLQILVFHGEDLDLVERRLTQAGMRHAGIQTARKKVATREGPKVVPVRVLELGDESPEARLAFADNPPAEVLDAQLQLEHPNGATALEEATLCVAPDSLDAVASRYATYLGGPPTSVGETRTFELHTSRLTVCTEAALEQRMPGERAPSLPALVAYAVSVRDLAAARQLLERNGVTVRTSAAGELYVPASAAVGAAILFREKGDRLLFAPDHGLR